MKKIREAVFSECLAIAKVHVKSWQETYQEIIDQQYLDELSVENREKMWEYYLTHESAKVFVAEVEGKIVGFSSTEFREYPSPNSAYLASIYLLQEYQGLKLGKELFSEGINHLRKTHSEVFIEVISDNLTFEFYRKFGAQFVEEKEIEISGKTIKEILLKISFN